MESGRTSWLQIRSAADVEPNIPDITAVSNNKGDRRDPGNETDESNPERRPGPYPNSDRCYFHGPSIRCPNTGHLAHNHRGDGHPYREGGRHTRTSHGRDAG